MVQMIDGSSSIFLLIIILCAITYQPIECVSSNTIISGHAEHNNDDAAEEQAVARSALMSALRLLTRASQQTVHSSTSSSTSSEGQSGPRPAYGRNDFEVPLLDDDLTNDLILRSHRQENDENESNYPEMKVLLKHKRTDLRSEPEENGADDDTCETLSSTIKIVKEETDESGNVIKTCEATIMVNKCEGLCSSHLHPSVSYATGFIKVTIIYFFKYNFLTSTS